MIATTIEGIPSNADTANGSRMRVVSRDVSTKYGFIRVLFIGPDVDVDLLGILNRLTPRVLLTTLCLYRQGLFTEVLSVLYAMT